MKKLLLIPTLVFPYLFVFFLYCICSGFLLENVTNIFPVLIWIPIFYVLALVCGILFFVRCWKQGADPYSLALTNMVIKLAHIPAYLFIFLLGAIMMVTILFPVALILWLVDCATIALSGLIGAAAVQQNRPVLSNGSTIVHTVLQFVFCADLVSAVILFIKARRACCSQP